MHLKTEVRNKKILNITFSCVILFIIRKKIYNIKVYKLCQKLLLTFNFILLSKQ